MHSMPVALTIAGSDPSGGAGLQADLKVFHQRGVYGMSVVTLLTVQNTRAVQNVFVLGPEMVSAQLDALLSDLPCHAAKTGALGNARVISEIAVRAKSFRFPLVVDPVMASQHGQALLDREAVTTLKKELFPSAFLITPNLDEAESLTGMKVRDLTAMEKAAKCMAQDGPQAILIKGGHLEGDAVDLLYAGGKVQLFESRRIKTAHTHGTGCAFSAVITAELAKSKPLERAIQTAKAFVSQALESSPKLGQGEGPLNLFVNG